VPHPRGLDLLVLREDLPERSVDSLVAVAKLGKAWGVRGELTVRLYNPDSDLAWAADAVHLRGEAFPLAWVSVQGWEDKAGKLLVKFEGVNTPHDAKALIHLEILVPAEDLSEADEDEVFVHELLGMAVIDEKRGDIGRIVNVLTIGPNDVWVVQGDTETMIPAVGQFVRSVDREARVVHVLYEEE
jgi:16S rRNA processing protein RimM